MNFVDDEIAIKLHSEQEKLPAKGMTRIHQLRFQGILPICPAVPHRTGKNFFGGIRLESDRGSGFVRIME
jgi:hypothetical protein